MDVLTNKTSQSKDYITRYANFPYYYHTIDKKFIQGLTAHLDTNTSYATVKVTVDETLDALANKYYGRPDYWWIIADFNHIQDPFVALYPKFSTLKIPSISDIAYVEEI